jgi:ubiquinone/menaquinone biosynthesis C-methylase UbiE
VMRGMGDVSGRRVLDVGCGDGTLAIELARRGAIVTGIDLSSAMIEAAKASARQQAADVEFAVAPAERMPFSAEHFDIVAAVTILCFVKDAAPAFEEIARVLRPGGRLVIGESANGVPGRRPDASGPGWGRNCGAAAGFARPASCVF